MWVCSRWNAWGIGRIDDWDVIIMDAEGLLIWVGRFIKQFPDDQYRYTVLEDRNLRSFCFEANENQNEFEKAGEILEEMK